MKARSDLKHTSADLCADLGMSDDDSQAEMDQWPDFFDVDSVPQVRKTELKPKPKVQGF